MYDLKLIAVGKLKENYLRNKLEEYKRTIEKKNKITIIELADESIPKNAGETINNSIKKKEGERILEHIDNTDYVIALCIDGKPLSSKEFAKVIDAGAGMRNGKQVLVIGGSLGLDDKVIRRADFKLSFSKMTFPHQLIRIMLLEQMADYL